MLRRAVAKAADRAAFAGAAIDVVALAAVRATREATVARGREKLPSILGTLRAGEVANGETFDGDTEVATFPGDLPDDPEELFKGSFRGLSSTPSEQADFRFLRFRPPLLEQVDGKEPALPHIRLDRAPVSARRPTAMSEKTPHRRPATFKLGDPGVIVMDPDDTGRPARGTVHITPEADPVLLPVPLDAPRLPVRRGFRWGTLFWSAVGGLVLLGSGLGIVNLIEDLFARSQTLGYVALAFAIAAALALTVVIAREAFGMMRLAAMRSCICALQKC